MSSHGLRHASGELSFKEIFCLSWTFSLSVVELLSCNSTLFVLVFCIQMCACVFASVLSARTDEAWSLASVQLNNFYVNAHMKVKVQRLRKTQQPLKGLQRVLVGTETWHNLASGISPGFTCWLCLLVVSPKHPLLFALFYHTLHFLS